VNRITNASFANKNELVFIHGRTQINLQEMKPWRAGWTAHRAIRAALWREAEADRRRLFE
jgi:hypothetical protein